MIADWRVQSTLPGAHVTDRSRMRHLRCRVCLPDWDGIGRVRSCGVKPDQCPTVGSAQPATAPSKRPFFVSFVEGRVESWGRPQVDTFIASQQVITLSRKTGSTNCLMLHLMQEPKHATSIFVPNPVMTLSHTCRDLVRLITAVIHLPLRNFRFHVFIILHSVSTSP